VHESRSFEGRLAARGEGAPQTVKKRREEETRREIASEGQMGVKKKTCSEVERNVGEGEIRASAVPLVHVWQIVRVCSLLLTLVCAAF